MKKQDYLLTILLLSIMWFLPSCNSCKPNKPNFALIGYWDIPGGETYTVEDPIPGSQTVGFIGRVYYPSYDENAIKDLIDGNPVNYNGLEVASGEHPLVVFGHGQFGNGAPNNYKGMTNLMYHLASWGYICISVNLDVLQGQWPGNQQGIPQRGELLLHATDFMIGLDSDAASLFYNRLDENKIAMIGHSRGGGGVVSAVNDNLTESSPRSILAVATISPVDFHVDPVQGAVPHLSLYGSWDGDLFDGEGPRLWSGGVRLTDKVFVEIYGANHFHFTDNISYWAETHDITRDEHQEIAQGFINAFFDKYVRGQNNYSWPQYLTGLKRINNVDYYIQYLSYEYESIDDGSPLGTPTLNNLTGSNDGSTLSLFDDKLLDDYNDHFYNESEGLIVHWDDSGDQLVVDFPVHDASQFVYLCFRVSQRPDYNINQVEQLKNFRVMARDALNNTSTVQIQNYQGGLQYPDSSKSISSTSPFQCKSILRSYRIPFEDLTNVDFSKVNQVTFMFDLPAEDGFDNLSGAIAIDDLEFSN